MMCAKFPDFLHYLFALLLVLVLSGATRFFQDISNSGDRSDGNSEYEIQYVGCTSAWESQGMDLVNRFKHDDEFTHESCAKFCFDMDPSYQISFLKGSLCQCTSFSNFRPMPVAKSLCNIPCPVKELDSYVWPPRIRPKFPCGGNLGYSVYCRWKTVDRAQWAGCTSVVEQHRQQEGLHNFTVEDIKKSASGSPRPQLLQQVYHAPCTKCNLKHDSHRICNPSKLSPDFDYFPVNSPEECIQFCGSAAYYFDNESADFRIRYPTPYAALLWWMETRGENEETLLPICRCVSHKLRRILKKVSPATCQATCPGDFDMKCGGIKFDYENEKVYFFANVYCIEFENGECASGYRPPTETTTIEFSTEGEEEVTAESSSPTTSTTASLPETPSPPSSCSQLCEDTDRFGHTWQVCAGRVGRTNCADIIVKKSVGVAYWTCSETGKFETRQPNTQNCSSPWLEDKWKKCGQIKDIKSAQDLIKELTTDVKNSVDPDSVTKYFGHEIKRITSLGCEIIKRSLTFNETLTSQIQPIIGSVVELNAVLFENQDPWKDLIQTPFKASIITDLLNNTDDALFTLTNLTDHLKDFQEHFTPFVSFKALVESFRNVSRGSYTFPPDAENSLETHISLPNDWLAQLPKLNVVEIAAQAIDSDVVEHVMLGQYNDNDGEEPQKIINGGLISLTIKLSRPTLFQGRGVEVTFRHDTEAWGTEVTQLYRKLHEGEQPKAVLGSAKCAFWDSTSNTWSTRGCKLRESDRSKTICECNHLTAFAVLMDVHQYVGKNFGLEMLTLILSLASEVALILTIILLLSSKEGGLQRIRNTIIKNLSICLLFGNAMVVFVLDRHYFDMSNYVCMAMAMITHYIFQCAFMWMLIEGLQLYRMIVHVFDAQRRSYIKHFGVFAYGFPVIIIAVTALAGYLNGDHPYGGDIVCWLEGNYIWSFMGPAAFVIVVNLSVLLVALKISFQLEQKKDIAPRFLLSKVRAYNSFFRKKFKGCISLTILLGLTWSVGYFMLMKDKTGHLVIAYIFTILNSSQGLLIFLLNWHVFGDRLRSISQRKILPSWMSPSPRSSSWASGIGADVNDPNNDGAGNSNPVAEAPSASLRRGKLSISSVH